MLFDFIGRVSDATQLKDSLDVSTLRVHGIAQRVSAASVPGVRQEFSIPGPDGEPVSATVDLEAEMTALADVQLRYDAAAKLLEKAYQRVRVSLRNG